jgi:hypothetical protein
MKLANYRRKKPGRGLGKLQFPKLLAEAWMKTAAPRVLIAGFKSTGFTQLIQMSYQKRFSRQALVSERPIHSNVNRGQEAPPGCNNQETSTTPKEATLACSTLVGPSFREIMPAICLLPSFLPNLFLRP